MAFNTSAVRGFILKATPSSRAQGHYTAFCSWQVGPSIDWPRASSRCSIIMGSFVSAYHRPLLWSLPHPRTKHSRYFLCTFALSEWPKTVHSSFAFMCAMCGCSTTTKLCSWSHYRSTCFCTALYLQRYCQIIPPMVAILLLLFLLFPANHISYTQ